MVGILSPGRLLGGQNLLPPTPAAPVNAVLPAVIGTPTVGSTVTATSGSWSAYPNPTFTYQWKRGGVAVIGETSASYTIVSADVGQSITVTVTATNASGSASATSDPVTGQAGASTGNNLIWASGNPLTWDTGNNLIWGTA